MEDLHTSRARGRALSNAGKFQEAAGVLVMAAANTLVAESDYVQLLQQLYDALLESGDTRSALSVLWYIARNDAGASQRALGLLPNVPAIDRGRTLAMRGDMAGAAKEMEAAGLVASAAIFQEKAGNDAAACALWSRLGHVARSLKADGYVEALVQFNIARSGKRSGKKQNEAMLAAVRLLEEAADHFESIGLRERAFDCFQVLIQVGRESGAFEDVLEGYVNCIRILREDHLKYFALQYYEEAVKAAREREELSAAATLAREASEYARSLGMYPAASHYTLMHAELFHAVSGLQKARGAPPEIGENAVLAAVLAFGELSQFARVGALFRELALMDLEPSKQAHYLRASKRYDGLSDEKLEAAGLPAHLRQENSFPDVWHVDVVEWEQKGSALEACADVLLDKRWPDLIRRRALIARITAFAAERTDLRKPDEAAEHRLAEQLADLQLYSVLSPMEHLYERSGSAVKVAVVSSMQRLSFKRTFTTVRKALAEADQSIVQAASRTTEALYFQHAFDPLARIVRESSDPNVRASALRALSRIDSQEAAEFLMGVLDHGAPFDRVAATEALKKSRGISRFSALATLAAPTASPELKRTLADIASRQTERAAFRR
jgi:HEAT repeats